jgi:nucleotide-binding universal stress UspA family protein
MKSILVPLSGSSTDRAVMKAAYAVADRLNAHMDFVHVPLSGVDLRVAEPHIDFARGASLGEALKEVTARSEAGEAQTRASVEAFCKGRDIVEIDRPELSSRVSASWVAKSCGDIDALLRCARAHELIVLGRSSFGSVLSLNLLDRLVTECGRPILLVPPAAQSVSLDTVAIWWKDHVAAARAVSAAMPVIAAARRVSVVTAGEGGGSYAGTATELAAQIGWHGVEAGCRFLKDDGKPVIDALWAASLAEKADLVVMGAYSHSRMRELIFGGCTQSVLEACLLPVLLQY